MKNHSSHSSPKKKASSLSGEVLVLLLIGIVVAILILLPVGKQVLQYIGIFPTYNTSAVIKPPTSENVPEAEKSLTGKWYPVIKVRYDYGGGIGGNSDYYTFRWNPSLGERGKPQVTMYLRYTEAYKAKEWYTDPDNFSPFREGVQLKILDKGDDNRLPERDLIKLIMRQSTKEEMVAKIVEIVNADKGDILAEYVNSWSEYQTPPKGELAFNNAVMKNIQEDISALDFLQTQYCTISDVVARTRSRNLPLSGNILLSEIKSAPMINIFGTPGCMNNQFQIEFILMDINLKWYYDEKFDMPEFNAATIEPKVLFKGDPKIGSYVMNLRCSGHTCDWWSEPSKTYAFQIVDASNNVQ